jgi:hypothetical protein
MNATPSPDTLQRPIRADKLQDWLRAIQHGFEDTRPTTWLSSAPSQSSQPPQVQEPEAPLVISPLRFKLRRWPPAALLRSDPNRIRMATILSRRALNATELASISGQNAGECQAFLQTLQTTGLVEVQQEIVAAPRVDQSAQAASPPINVSASKPTFARGLISGIRRRLGL